MSRPLGTTGARFCGLLVLWLGVELLERVAYRAGVATAAAVFDDAAATAFVIPISDEDLEAFDATDVLAFHGYTVAA